MSLRKALFEIYWATRRLIAPNLKYSQYLYEDELKNHVQSHMRWLDLGCGHSILPQWRIEVEKRLFNICAQVTGLDFDLPSLKAHQTILRRVQGDIGKLPFRDQSFDLVTMNMVVEHLNDPDHQFGEVRRVLAPKGLLVFHTPNALGYGTLMARLIPDGVKGLLISILEGRKEEDVFKTYYRANTQGKILHLAQLRGYSVLKIRMIVTDAVFAMVPPLFVLELIWLRVLMTRPFKALRTNIIAVLQKRY